MGLFDTVRCQARVPGSELLGDGEFQTSDLGRWCDRFTIDISGNLVHHRTRNQPEKPLWRYMTDRDIAIPIHRDIRLTGDDATGCVAHFVARFTDGRLQWVKRLEQLSQEEQEYFVVVEG